MQKTIREKLIAAGVNNLKEFGYPSVNKENILTDKVYAAFFKTMLVENIGVVADLDIVINELIKEVENNLGS